MTVRILTGDCRQVLPTLPERSVQCVVTSPPYYGLRDYNVVGQIGLEPSIAEYLETMVAVFREVRRVLRDDGTVWLNIGDSYAGSRGGEQGETGQRADRRHTAHVRAFRPGAGRADGKVDERAQRNRDGVSSPGMKPKDLMLIPARLAIALQDDGWYVRADIIWHKTNAMPESVTDRPTSAHEHIFLLTKSKRYFYDQEAVRESLAENTIRRLSQDSFADQTGGEKDYANGNGDPNSSARRILENLHRPFDDKAKRDTRKSLPPQQKDDRASNWTDRHGGYQTALENGLRGANQRNVWSMPSQPYPGAHFATFPAELPKRCISAGTSERGQCPACGAPWTRVVARGATNGRTAVNDQGNGELAAGARFGDSTGHTAAWRPGCTCDAGEPVLQTVLDPFSGAGTTGLVADRLGRHYLGIELSTDYAEQSRTRIVGDAPLFADVAVD